MRALLIRGSILGWSGRRRRGWRFSSILGFCQGQESLNFPVQEMSTPSKMGVLSPRRHKCHNHMGVSKNNGTSKSSLLNPLNRVFHYKPSILGAHPYFWKHPHKLLLGEYLLFELWTLVLYGVETTRSPWPVAWNPNRFSHEANIVEAAIKTTGHKEPLNFKPSINSNIIYLIQCITNYN